MGEVRHDTVPMSRADIEAALESHRETLPMPEATVTVCGACGGSGVNRTGRLLPLTPGHSLVCGCVECNATLSRMAENR